MKTKSIGVRLPVKLYDLVRSANPDKSFSEIVVCALKEKYSFTEPDINIKNEGVHSVKSIESKLDKLLNSCAQEGNK